LEFVVLINTFCHISSISLKKEIDLWRQGIFTWGDYRKHHPASNSLDESEKHLSSKNATFFASALDSHQLWRLVPDFRDSIAYVDIETTGLSKGYNEITTIALYNGQEVFTYVNGKNLTKFTTDIQQYKMIVTYNGKTFDVPFIEKYFGIKLPHVHIDLRYPLQSLGLTGGLKMIEHRLGINRGDLQNLDGFFAVRLWHEYQRNKNANALETLLAYNCADVVNLEFLLLHVFNKNLEATPFQQQKLPAPLTAVKIPFQADKKLIARLA
jgi:uncharacterized protein